MEAIIRLVIIIRHIKKRSTEEFTAEVDKIKIILPSPFFSSIFCLFDSSTFPLISSIFLFFPSFLTVLEDKGKLKKLNKEQEQRKER